MTSTDDDPTARHMADELRRTGQVSRAYHNDAERDELRRTGRRAARILSRPIQTLARSGVLHIVLTGWGDNPLERQLDDAKTRNAIDRALGNRQ